MQTDESTQSITDSYGLNRNTVTETAKRRGRPLRRDKPPRKLLLTLHPI